jgi:hypothetical protein
VLEADTPWVVAEDQPEPVERALEDVKSDWYKVFGHPPIVLREPPTEWKGPLIYLGWNGGWREALLKDSFAGPECFVLRTVTDLGGRQALIATGADIRGSIYAAYTLSEEILGVDPWYYWVDKEPVRQERIDLPAGFERRFGPPTFRYRGWFINDEDLLWGFAPDPMRENNFSLEMHDRILETLLRLRGNMIVPGTFPYPDERCQELAARRGLALNMHHVSVVGLNTYRWPKDVPFSYHKHPEIMEQYWQTCIDAFRGHEVVWTVGYRGKFDQPFWVDDPQLQTPKARGAVVTRAIAKQTELIRKADPEATIIANLWEDGSRMMHAGHLQLPEGVIQVWSDDGTGIINDKGTVKAGQGLYYHVAVVGSHFNQITEAVGPRRIYSEVGRFVLADATEYFLLNVSDIRPVPATTDCAMRLAWEAKPWVSQEAGDAGEAFLADWSQRQFGADVAREAAAIYADYFNIPYQRRDQRFGENHLHTLFRMLDRKAVPLIESGRPLTEADKKQHWSLAGPDYDLLEQAEKTVRFAQRNRAYVDELLRKAESLALRVAADRHGFYQDHVLIPIRIHLHSLEMLEAYGQAMAAYDAGDGSRCLALVEESLQAVGALFAAAQGAEHGKWSRWFIGERFVGLESNRDQLRVLRALLRGESPPPVRHKFDSHRAIPKGGVYGEICRYQEPFQKNFPLLYRRAKE